MHPRSMVSPTMGAREPLHWSANGAMTHDGQLMQQQQHQHQQQQQHHLHQQQQMHLQQQQQMHHHQQMQMQQLNGHSGQVSLI